MPRLPLLPLSAEAELRPAVATFLQRVTVLLRSVSLVCPGH